MLTPEEIIDILMEDPVTIYSVMVSYWDNTKKLYSFSLEEYQIDFVECMTENADSEGIREMVMFESLVDYTNTEYEYFMGVH